MKQLTRGIVIKSTGSRYKVLDEAGNTHECTLRGKFRVRGSRTTNPVAVGDNVTIDEADEVITTLAPRRNYIIRKATNLSRESQIIAANIDQALLMVSLKMHATPIEFIDRFLATAEAYRIPTSIVINKSDLHGPEEETLALRLKSVYEKIGYPVYIVSVTKDVNTDLIEEALKGKTTLLSGNSGVGKSTLLNRLNPSLSLKTKKISDYHEQGKHVTTFPEMHQMPFDAFVIDTPGIRGFGVVDMERNEIYHFFREIFEKSRECRFNNCLHLDEPGCAVRDAVENGEIAFLRYKSYLNIMDGDDGKYR